MARIRIFHASVNPECYDLNKLAAMNFDEAVEYFENETEICACNTGITTIDDTKPHEFTLHAEGTADNCCPDTMLNWVKVDCCY